MKHTTPSKFNEVDWNQIWRETIKKETRNIKLNPNFHINPRTVHAVTTKPNQRPNRFLDKDAYLIQYLKKKGVIDLPEEVKLVDQKMQQEKEREEKNIKKSEKYRKQFNECFFGTPKQKYKKPVTTSQEMGWFSDPIIRNSYFYRPKSHCEETKYANHYMKEIHMQKRVQASNERMDMERLGQTGTGGGKKTRGKK